MKMKRRKRPIKRRRNPPSDPFARAPGIRALLAKRGPTLPSEVATNTLTLAASAKAIQTFSEEILVLLEEFASRGIDIPTEIRFDMAEKLFYIGKQLDFFRKELIDILQQYEESRAQATGHRFKPSPRLRQALRSGIIGSSK